MKRTLVTVGAVVALAVAGLVVTQSAGAVDIYQACGGFQDSVVCEGRDETSTPIIVNIINLLLTAAAVISVIMIIIGGFKYATSNGDSNKVASAKNTILYAIIGLLVAGFAVVIVTFVKNYFGL